MGKTFDMQDLRNLKLFTKITKVITSHCIKYNDTIIFAVPKIMMSKSLGKNAENIQKMKRILKKRVKIIPMLKGEENMKAFFTNIVNPTEFKDLEVLNDEIIITGGRENKAALIGRNKRRLLELQTIARDYYGKGLKIA